MTNGRGNHRAENSLRPLFIRACVYVGKIRLALETSLLDEIQPSIIDYPALASLKKYFTPDTWMALLQKGVANLSLY